MVPMPGAVCTRTIGTKKLKKKNIYTSKCYVFFHIWLIRQFFLRTTTQYSQLPTYVFKSVNVLEIDGCQVVFLFQVKNVVCTVTVMDGNKISHS